MVGSVDIGTMAIKSSQLTWSKEKWRMGGPITRRVKVEMVVWNRGQRTLSGFLLKKKPVEQYNLWVKELIIP